MHNFILYGHGGSGNHGCEAIVRSLIKIVNNIGSYDMPLLMAARGFDDIQYEIDKIANVSKVETINPSPTTAFLHAYLRLKLLKQYEYLDSLPYIYAVKNDKKKYSLALSIGGDNYCYGDTSNFACINRSYNKLGIKTALIGCSIEPNIINNTIIERDLSKYAVIIARESITFEALHKAGLRNIKLLPEPAFQLDRIDLPLPKGFTENNTVGLNISHIIIEAENHSNLALNSCERLIEHIIDTTDMQIALIPHVVWEGKDDRVPLRMLYEKYKDTGRVVMIEDHNCMELKGYIARCRFMIAARTHASIAAYSTCVPTLVVGYSVKAQGIAKDIFGTYENYVLPVQSLSKEDDLKNAFDWIYKNENQIRAHLQSMMPEYRERALLIGEELKKIM